MKLPVTRYYGSKRKLVDKIWAILEQEGVEFDSFLDLFGGTGIVSYYMAHKGKNVIYNDILLFNCTIAHSLMNCRKYTLTEEDAVSLLEPISEREYRYIITENYQNIYYTAEENEIIDVVVQNIQSLPLNQQACAYYVLFQSCMIKRPFNLFHRNNLNLRTNFTHANFGNKVTWEQSFKDLFIKFTRELNEFQPDEDKNYLISNQSALHCQQRADLVYIDTPYFPKTNRGSITYHNRYHFLEGLMHYGDIIPAINFNKVNREISIGCNKEFEQRGTYLDELESLIRIHQDSIIALSYTTEGYPDVETIRDTIARYKPNTQVYSLGKHSFALNRHNAERCEVLILGR